MAHTIFQYDALVDALKDAKNLIVHLWRTFVFLAHILQRNPYPDPNFQFQEHFSCTFGSPLVLEPYTIMTFRAHLSLLCTETCFSCPREPQSLQPTLAVFELQ
jgi:hypothetical protein